MKERGKRFTSYFITKPLQLGFLARSRRRKATWRMQLKVTNLKMKIHL